MNKLIKYLLCLIFVIILSGCSSDKGLLIFNSVPINSNNALHGTNYFTEGQKVYYLFIAPKKLENSFIRVQVFTMTEKASIGDIDVVRTKDFRLMKDQQYYYTDYFTFMQKGKYVMQVFSHDDFKTPLAVNYFLIR